MKQIRWAVITLFAAMILLPLAAFDREADVVSAIDNRKLAAAPFSEEAKAANADLTARIEKYVNDRIGFRDQMILGYTVFNDRVFGKMIHPSYCYGKDGYVFPKMRQVAEYNEFYQSFADVVAQIDAYCRQREVPFLLVLDPVKTAVLTDKLPRGINYDRGWVDAFLQAVKEAGVHVVDNTGLMQEKTAEGVEVFNRKYDAGHWNSIGAYYGVNAILEAMREEAPGIQLNRIEDFTVSEELQTTLPVSEFPIKEWTPVVTIPMELENRAENYHGEVALDDRYRAFAHLVNNDVSESDTPRTLMFQGSYMNGKGWPYMGNVLHEYIYVHNYQNLLNFDYYFNLFQPEYVIFEVTEYAATADYFDPKKVADFCLNPTLKSVRDAVNEYRTVSLPTEELDIEKGHTVTKLNWISEGDEAAVWLTVDGTEFDLRRCEEGGWEVSVQNTVLNGDGDFELWALSQDGALTKYA